MNALKGTIFNIQRFSIDDGPGIRTTVFFKGCPLRCVWCHNPEGIERRKQLVWFDGRCIGDRECVESCPKSALELLPGGMIIHRELCHACGICVEACPSGALEMVGRECTVEEVLEEIRRDATFYENSGGGMTASGGEPTAQPLFVAELFRRCSDEGIHTALDTSGYCGAETFREVVEAADMVLLDLKVMDDEVHRYLTDAPLGPIIENVRMLERMGKRTWVRTPVIPGMTNSPQNISELGSFIKRELSCAQRWDLLAFNNACESKYRRLDMDWALKGMASMKSEEMEDLAEIARKSCQVEVHWSGPTMAENS